MALWPIKQPPTSHYNASPNVVRYCDMAIFSRNPAIDDDFVPLDQLADIGRTMERRGIDESDIRIDRKPISQLSTLEQWAIDLGRREVRYRESESPLS